MNNLSYDYTYYFIDKYNMEILTMYQRFLDSLPEGTRMM
jgi:hypothetical protein